MPEGKLRLGYRARKPFIPFHLRTERFACLVCHRRAGKTVASVHDLQDGVLRSRLERPKFAYIGPYLKQGKAVAWDYLRSAAEPLRLHKKARINEAELSVTYDDNGGQLRIYGGDNPDALRGIYLDGVVMDEYADMDPRLWPEVIRPTLADRKGKAVFIGTPRGHNAFYGVWKQAQEDPTWFSMMLKAHESGIIPLEELESIKTNMTEDQYAQEFECSFEAAIQGAYYAKQVQEAQDTKRIVSVPYEPSAPVWTAWDLGMRDATAIWFAQVIGKEVHIIDYYEASGVDLGHYVRELKNRPYVYARHIVPPDAAAKELGTGKSRVETLQNLGLFSVHLLEPHRVEDGINEARLLLPKCWFDKTKCERGVEALKVYRAETDRYNIDPISKVPLLKPHPVHDWASHAADAFRYLAMGIDHKGLLSAFYKPIEYPKLGIA